MFPTQELKTLLKSNSAIARGFRYDERTLLPNTKGRKVGDTLYIAGVLNEETARRYAAVLGIDFDQTGYTFAVKKVLKDGKTVFYIDAPEVKMAGAGVPSIVWGNVIQPLSAIDTDCVDISPNIQEYDTWTSYSLSFLPDGWDIPIEMKLAVSKDSSPSIGQIKAAIKGKGDWNFLRAGLYPGLSTVVSADNPEMTFEVTKVEVAKIGKFSKLLLTTDKGLYTVADGKSLVAQNIRQNASMGEDMTDNPMVLTIVFEGVKKSGNGSDYNAIDVVECYRGEPLDMTSVFGLDEVTEEEDGDTDDSGVNF